MPELAVIRASLHNGVLLRIGIWSSLAMCIARATVVRMVTVLIVVVASAFQARAQDKGKIEVVPQIGHWGDVHAVESSPDGTLVLSAGDRTLKLWDAASSALLRTFQHPARAVASSPAGARLLSGGYDNTLKLWDATTGALLRPFGGHSLHVARRSSCVVGQPGRYAEVVGCGKWHPNTHISGACR